MENSMVNDVALEEKVKRQKRFGPIKNLPVMPKDHLIDKDIYRLSASAVAVKSKRTTPMSGSETSPSDYH